MINKHDFETDRRREFIYRHYRCNVREPFLLAKIKQFEQLEKSRSNRTRFKTQQYNQFLQFINKHVRHTIDKVQYLMRYSFSITLLKKIMIKRNTMLWHNLMIEMMR